MKPRKPIKKVSDRQKKRLAEYAKVNAKFKKANPWCQACKTIWNRDPRPTKDTHHTRGRNGPLLTDVRYFKAVCRQCHDWVKNNTTSARIAGLICAEGKWNTPQR